jgi:hypothetical protein
MRLIFSFRNGVRSTDSFRIYRVLLSPVYSVYLICCLCLGYFREVVYWSSWYVIHFYRKGLQRLRKPRAQRHPVALYEKSGISWSRSKHLYSASLAREAVQTFPRELVTAEHRRRMKNISEERTWADTHFESYEAGKTCSFIHPWFTSPHSTFCCQLSYFSPNLARKMKQLGRP